MGKEKQRPLPKSELAGLQTEALFEYHAGKTGVNVYPGKPITCDHPVGSGRSKKQYTLPDFFLVDPIRQRGIHVEVTAGNAPKRADKRMQRKVAEAAHVTNYVQVSGDDVLALAEAPPKKKRSILFHILGW